MAKKPRRVVLGIGYPWYSKRSNHGDYTHVELTQTPVNPNILLRGREKNVELNYGNTGNWNKVRLVLEILT